MKDVRGRHVWIIGASSGIGRALARALDQRGAILTVSARNAQALDALVAEMGGRHRALPLDVTDAAGLHEAATGLGRVDAVICMAGHYEPASVLEGSAEALRAIINTNLIGAFNVARAVVPMLRRQQGGMLALCGSVAGYRGLPNGQPYAATKAAIISLAESLRAEEAKNNIDIRIINPGFVDTPMTKKNSFAMPMMVTPEVAARAIIHGLGRGRFEIHFPKRMTWALKLLRLMPDTLYFKIVERL